MEMSSSPIDSTSSLATSLATFSASSMDTGRRHGNSGARAAGVVELEQGARRASAGATGGQLGAGRRLGAGGGAGAGGAGAGLRTGVARWTCLRPASSSRTERKR
jgi:hypothetical protein